MTDGYFSFNNPTSNVLPLPSLTQDPTAILQLADPVLYNLAQFFTQILQSNIGQRFQDECHACGVTNSAMSYFVDNTAVAQTVVFPLYPHLLRTTNFQFPLISIYPEKEEFDQLTTQYLATRRQICISWVLPPLTPMQYNRLYPFLGQVAKAWLAFGYQGYDPKVNPNGPSVWETSNLAFGIMQGCEYKPYPGASQIKGTNQFVEDYFPSIQMRFSFEEKNQAPVPQNYESFSGISLLEVDLVDGYNISQPYKNVADGYVYPTIQVTGLTPTSGSVNGNTLITITGQGFNANDILYTSQITVAGVQVKSFLVKSPTVILAVTNPQVAQTGAVVITDLNGNTYAGPNFTYQ